VQRTLYWRALDVPDERLSVAIRTVTNRRRRRAAIALSHSFPLTDDHSDLSQTRGEILLTMAHELFTRWALLRFAVQTIRTASVDLPEILPAIDTIDQEATTITRVAEGLLVAMSFEGIGLPT
jgi:hypothetical protein